MTRWGVLLFCVTLCASALAETTVSGHDDLVHATVLTDLSRLPLNEIHTWRVRLQNDDGEPVSGVAVSVLGGMPMHDHGLPTEPVATEVEPGLFEIQGVRLHMHGHWELTLEIRDSEASDAADLLDSVTVKFEL